MSMAPPPSSVRRHGVSVSASHALPVTPNTSGMRASPSDPVLTAVAGSPYPSVPPPPVHKTAIPASKSSTGAGLAPTTNHNPPSSRARSNHSPFPSHSSISVHSPSGRPVTPGHRVTRSVGYIPVTPNSVESRRQTWESPSARTPKEPTLPNNPSVWTPSELAQYLSFSLRNGGKDRTGPTLPAPVIEDVVSWVLRSRVTGSQFMRGFDHSITRPPPFLPVLTAMSRRMRREHGPRLSDASQISVTEDEGSPDAGLTRVRRLAHAFDVISSASEASGDEGPSLSSLRDQIAPETVHGFGRATPRSEARQWARRDSAASTMSSMSAASGFSANSNPRWRQRVDSNASAISAASSSQAWAFDSPEASSSQLPESPSAALRTKAETKAEEEASHSRENVLSPPPPYDTPSAVPSPTRTGLLFPPEPEQAPSTPEASQSMRSGTVTPHCAEQQNNTSDEESPTLVNHLHRMSSHQAGGVDPYAVLRREGETRPRLPFAREEETSDDDQPHWTTTRRVTARPRSAHASPEPLTPAVTTRITTPVSKRRRHQREMEREVASLTGRIRELEARLAAVETPKAEEQVSSDAESPVETPPSPAKAVVPSKKRGWLASLGLAGDGTEAGFQVPAVLFLMGVGVGAGFSAVIVRLLISQSR